MAVYHNYTQCYVAPPLAYEQSLLLQQREKELFELREKIHLQEKAFSQKDEEIRLLKTKNENLLKGYNKRQANYSMALNVTKAKNEADSQELGELRTENKKLREQLQSQVKVQVKENTKLVRGTFTLADIEGASRKVIRKIPTLADNGGQTDNLVRGIFTVVEIEAFNSSQAFKMKQLSILPPEDGRKSTASSIDGVTKAETTASPMDVADNIKPVICIVGNEKAKNLDDGNTKCWADLEPKNQACIIPEWADVDVARVRVSAGTESEELVQQLQGKVEVHVKDVENTMLVKGTFTLAEIEGASGKAIRRIPTPAENGDESDNLVRGTFTVVEIEALSIIDKASTIKESSLLHAEDGSKPFASCLKDGTKAVEQADIKPLAGAISDEETEKIDDEIITSWADIEPENQACEIPEWANVDVANVRAAADIKTTINESIQARNTFAVAESYAPVDATRLPVAEDTDKAINFSTRPTNTCAVAECLDPLDAPPNQAKFFHGVYNVWDIEAGVLVRAHC